MMKPRESTWLDRTASSGVTEGRDKGLYSSGSSPASHTTQPSTCSPLSGLISHKQRSGLFPQNKLSLLSSCSREVQDALRGASPGGHPSALKDLGRGDNTDPEDFTFNNFGRKQIYSHSGEEHSRLLKNPVTLTYQANSLVLLLLAHSSLAGSKARLPQRQEDWKIMISFKSKPAHGILKNFLKKIKRVTHP